MKYSGKKILILGSNAGSVDLVQYARKNGATVYVADNLPSECSPAKLVADHPLMISTNDFEGLSSVVYENDICAVFSGISEFNILNAMKLSKKCGLRFYCTKDQWDYIESKDFFRTLCEKHSVPVPVTFFKGSNVESIEWDSITYPVVVKPVDCGASTGVFICDSERRLKEGIPQSIRCSGSGKVIIESYEEGHEFTAHYSICDGKASLACIDNRYPVAVNEGSVTTIPVARIFPSLFADEYIEQVDKGMIGLCESLGLDNAVVFVQGIYNPIANRFSIFEAGLRSAAECPNRIIDSVLGLNYMHFLLDSVVIDDVNYDQSKEDPYLSGRCGGVISFVAKGGMVKRISNVEKLLKSTPEIIDYEQRYDIGDMTPSGNTLRQLMLRFVVNCDSREDLYRLIKKINDTVDVFDENNESLVLKMDPSRVFDLD